MRNFVKFHLIPPAVAGLAALSVIIVRAAEEVIDGKLANQ
jgi:hypothetical protein